MLYSAYVYTYATILFVTVCNCHMSCVCCIATVKECVDNLSQEDDKENLVASLWGAERCLRVLESVSTVLSSWILSCTKVTLE